MWEFVRRKRLNPTQGNGNGEAMVEHEGPPAQRPATAKTVVAALNKGFEMERKGKEKKTNSLMEDAPQNPTK